MSGTEEDEQPRKRVKLSEPEASNADVENEARVGISAYISPDTPGFTGVFKQRYGRGKEDAPALFLSFCNTLTAIGADKIRRYTDFLVNEILPSGRVLHLENLGLPSSKPAAERKPKAESPPASTAVEQVQPTAPDQAADVHENSLDTPKTEQAAEPDHGSSESLSAEDDATLQSIFGEGVTSAIKALHDRVLRQPHKQARRFPPVITQPIADKEQRTR